LLLSPLGSFNPGRLVDLSKSVTGVVTLVFAIL
jgi:hypothetical protein